jgi:hypothetical protein
VRRDHRRFLALLLTLLGMALASSAAHAGPLCTAGGDGPPALCDLAASNAPPPGVNSAFLYDNPVGLHSLAVAEPSGSEAGIVLPGQAPVEQAPVRGLLLGRAWSVSDYDEAALAQAALASAD